MRIQIRAQVFYRDLPFIFVAVRAAETYYASREFSAASVYDGERNEGVSPGAVQMERNLIVMLAWLVEIDLLRGVDESRHLVVWDEELSLPEYTTAFFCSISLLSVDGGLGKGPAFEASCPSSALQKLSGIEQNIVFAHVLHINWSKHRQDVSGE